MDSFQTTIIKKNKKGVKPLEFHAFTYDNLCLSISSLLNFLENDFN